MEIQKIGTRWLTGVTTAAGILALSAGTLADPPTTMAPPIQSSSDQSLSAGVPGASADSVFQWNEVPQNQQVPLRRAVFDQGGYQLYDTAGETIVVPFANQNLYVMKFAVSPDGTTYFVNTGSAPVLYIPRGGYLENASVAGAKWYPFSKEFHPAQPVFLGIAPSYTEFVGMGWYPDMVCYGGYYGYHPYVAGGVFLATLGLAFFIGGHPYYGWSSYHHYYYAHPSPYHVAFVNRNIYHFGGRSAGAFRGAGTRGFAGRPFGATGHGFSGAHAIREGRSFGAGHTFQGARGFSGTGSHTAYAHRTFSGTGTHTFQGARSVSGGNRSFGGNHSFGGGQAAPHNMGGNHNFGGGHVGGGGHLGGGGGEHGGRR